VESHGATGPLGPVAILGPGLIGGSLGLALHRHCPTAEVRVWARSPEPLEKVRALGFAATTSTDLAEIVAGARCVVLCTPVETMPALARRMLPALAPAAIVTDAGSVKGSVVAECEAILGERFLGAHPIAGSDRTGIDAATADLYEGATCVLTPTAQTSPAALQTARELWQRVGCRILEMSPEAHDAALARTSHLPHAVASAVAAAIERSVPGWPQLAGSGYRDATRIALGNPDLWTGILLANRAEVSTSIAELGEILQNMRAALEADDAVAIRALLAEGQTARQRFDGI
jgi:prephenate dehydrogenase